MKYDSLAHIYEARWEGYLDATHKVATDLLEPEANDIILDASAGTGLLIERMIPMIKDQGNFYLIDISKKMLEIARNRFKENENVFLSQQDVHSLGFEDNYFSKVISASSFHYYSEPDKVLYEFHRILKQNGALILVDWCRDPLYFKLFDLFMRLVSKAHVKTYSSKEFERLLYASKFNIEKIIFFRYGLWSLIGIRATKHQ